MELRVLNYFLTVARLGSVTKAASELHITQPTLSRQLMQLEEELGVALFVRGKRKMILTEDGLLLERRARELLELAHLTTLELSASQTQMSGTITIGCGLTEATKTLSDWMAGFLELYPQTTFVIKNGNTQNTTELIESGLVDLGVVLDPNDLEKYSSIEFPKQERWGLLTSKHSSLANKSEIYEDDLLNIPLLGSTRLEIENKIRQWCPAIYDQLNIVTKTDMAVNFLFLIKQNKASAIIVEGALEGIDMSDLVFIPFKPHLTSTSYLIYKKYQSFSLIVSKFIDYISKNELT